MERCAVRGQYPIDVQLFDGIDRIDELREHVVSRPPSDVGRDVFENVIAGDQITMLGQSSSESAHIVCDQEAAVIMVLFPAGFPKIMQLIGEAGYWLDNDDHIDPVEATDAVFDAAEEVGKRYVDQQVLNALRSPDYRSILKKIGSRGASEMTFSKLEVEKGLTHSLVRRGNSITSFRR